MSLRDQKTGSKEQECERESATSTSTQPRPPSRRQAGIRLPSAAGNCGRIPVPPFLPKRGLRRTLGSSQEQQSCPPPQQSITQGAPQGLQESDPDNFLLCSRELNLPWLLCTVDVDAHATGTWAKGMVPHLMPQESGLRADSPHPRSLDPRTDTLPHPRPRG